MADSAVDDEDDAPSAIGVADGAERGADISTLEEDASDAPFELRGMWMSSHTALRESGDAPLEEWVALGVPGSAVHCFDSNAAVFLN